MLLCGHRLNRRVCYRLNGYLLLWLNLDILSRRRRVEALNSICCSNIAVSEHSSYRGGKHTRGHKGRYGLPGKWMAVDGRLEGRGSRARVVVL